MIMRVQQAALSDYRSILAFYDDVIDRTPEIGRHAWWQKGKHPTAEGVRAYIEEGSMYLCQDDGAIIAVMALTPYQGEDYHPVKWLRDLADDEVAVIHILAVCPDRQGAGVGEQMVREAVRIAEEQGKKSLRLDTLLSNTPAQRLYERLGFVCRGRQHLMAENTGWTDFLFYEYSPGLLPSR
jgi:ribosomal protein S18 acetylase RimI-like enzyme